MSRNTWRFVLTIFVVAWALYELYPIKSRDLVQFFQERVEFTDTNFTAIVTQAKALQEKQPELAYQNLLAAAGTNDLSRYFPSYVEEDDADKNRAILNRLQQQAASSIRLGLDLQGGTEFRVSLDETRMENIADKQHAVEQAIEVLRRRVDTFGVAEPVLRPAGESGIVIQIPGMSEDRKESARATIQKVAFLEFRLVHPESDELVKAEIIEPGYELLQERSRRKRQGQERPVETYLVKRNAEAGLGGSAVRRAYVTLDPMTGKPRINLEFNSDGAEKFGEITRNNVGRQLAIVLDGELYSAPVIRTAILGGNAEITGDFEMKEAFELANALQNPLESPVRIEEERTVDPSLGADSISSGVTASIIASVGTFLFMMIFYLRSGLVANFALALNVLILMGAMCAMESTLTLPGIAGIALTIGMAVDANVLIYERMREEIAAGKSIKGIIAGGYDKAFGTIFDSNLTTLIASLLLIKFGTGPVKGFGVTLSIGLCVNFFTALIVTRMIYDFLLARGLITKVRMLPLIKFQGIPFMNWGKLAAIGSAAVIVIGLGYGVFVRGKDLLGVDFVGGDALTVNFKERVEVDALRGSLSQAGITDATIGYQLHRATGHETLQLVVPLEAGPKATAALNTAFPQAGFDVVGTDSVGPTVGAQIQRSALISSLLAMFGILIYVAFRYEFSFAVASVVALLHDVAVTLAVYFLSGEQLNATMVAAVLTIIGYSINDKIVVMDRIREDLKLGVRGTFRQLIDIALNQVLGRTMITGGAVMFSTLALMIFGGGAISDLAFVFLVGTLTGTYSSLLIASPLLLWWHKGERPKIGAQFEVPGPEGIPGAMAKAKA